MLLALSLLGVCLKAVAQRPQQLRDRGEVDLVAAGRVRRPGGGRKALVEIDVTLLADIERMVDEDCRGDPESLLRWTSKSVRHLCVSLREVGHKSSTQTSTTPARLFTYRP